MAIMCFIWQMQGTVESSVSTFARSNEELKKLVERKKKIKLLLSKAIRPGRQKSFIFLYTSGFHPTPFQDADEGSSQLQVVTHLEDYFKTHPKCFDYMMPSIWQYKFLLGIFLPQNSVLCRQSLCQSLNYTFYLQNDKNIYANVRFSS